MEGGEIQMNANIATPVSHEIAPQVIEPESFGNVDSFESGFDDTVDVQLNDIRGELEQIQIEDEVQNLQMDPDLDIYEDEEEVGIDQSGAIESKADVTISEELETRAEEKEFSEQDDEMPGVKIDKEFFEKNHSEILEKLNDFKESYDKLSEAKISNEQLLAMMMYLLAKTQEASSKEEKVGFLELLIMIIGRMMLEVAPGGDEVIEERKKKAQKRPKMPGLDEMQEKLLKAMMGRKMKSAPIEN